MTLDRLLAEPRAELQRVCEFAGIRYQTNRLVSVRARKCTAFTNKHVVKHRRHRKHKRLSDFALTKAQARAACARLVKDGVTAHVTSHGGGYRSGPAGDTGVPKPRNRRLVISFTY